MVHASKTIDLPSAPPTWRRVAELADLVEVFDPEVQICSWPRDLDPDIGTYLSELPQGRELQIIEELSERGTPRLDPLPDGPDRSSLLADLSLLQEIVCELLGSEAAGLRLARIGRAMCPGWHVDRTSIRLVCTYQGPGTEWLDDQDIDRQELGSRQNKYNRYVSAAAGEIVLLKGSVWQNNESFGAIHRSPDVRRRDALRTVVTLDPLWRG